MAVRQITKEMAQEFLAANHGGAKTSDELVAAALADTNDNKHWVFHDDLQTLAASGATIYKQDRIEFGFHTEMRLQGHTFIHVCGGPDQGCRTAH